MPIVDVFLSGTQKKNRGHLANIVKIAKSNGVLSFSEKKMLINIRKRLGISDQAFKRIVRKPESYPMNPSPNYEERIERLFTLTKMLFVDNASNPSSLSLLKKISVGIGFTIGKHEAVVDAAIIQYKANADLETFTKAIKKANGIS